MKIQRINMGRVWSFANVLVRLLLLAAGGAATHAGPGPVDSDVVFSNCLTEKTGSYTFPNPTGRLPEDFEFYFVCTNDDAGSGIRKGQVVAPNSFFSSDGSAPPTWTYFFDGTNSVTIACVNWKLYTNNSAEDQLDQIQIASPKHSIGTWSSGPSSVSNFVLEARWKTHAQSASTEIVYSNAMENYSTSASIIVQDYSGSFSVPNPMGKLPRFFEFYLVCTNDDPSDHYAKGQVASPNSLWDSPYPDPKTWCYIFDGTNGIILFKLGNPPSTTEIVSPSHPDPLKLRNIVSLDNFMILARLITDSGGVIVSNNLTHDGGVYTFANQTGRVPRNFALYFVCLNDDEDSGFKAGQGFSPNCLTVNRDPVDWSYSFDGTNSVTIFCPQFDNRAVITASENHQDRIQIADPQSGPLLTQHLQTSLTNFVLVARWE
ncbi:MAG TPA: hypothetical protein VGI03_03260 [Verrucomicrobiae bacterium]